MYKQSALNCIPEAEVEEDMGKKWVPKKKHEVLKAKYKCLKKLFQIYDASVIGILPEHSPVPIDDTTRTSHRRKRSHRTKTDACAATNDISSGDSECENRSEASVVLREPQLEPEEPRIPTTIKKTDKYAETIASDVSYEQTEKHPQINNDHQCIFTYKPQLPSYLYMHEKRKLTRFQSFVQRLFGLKRNYIINEELLATSDPTLSCQKRRRRGLRFRRLKKPQKIKSESALRNLENPTILSYIQSVQRSCLTDKTPRQCPILGCKMISYGIINYNDHLNLCHFKDKKFICHYCHEGFERDLDKFTHENDHIGLSKIGTSIDSSSRQYSKIANNSNTQTDMDSKVPEEKLKKMVSFFEKLSEPGQLFTDVKKNSSFESNSMSKSEPSSDTESYRSSQTAACSCKMCNSRIQLASSMETYTSSKPYKLPLSCRFCGEQFSLSRDLSLHIDLYHHQNKVSKFRSCAEFRTVGKCRFLDDAITYGQQRRQITPHTKTVNTVCQPKIEQVRTVDNVCRPTKQCSSTADSLATVADTCACDTSTTNVVCYTSLESLSEPHSSCPVRSVCSYRWEPGTKIIRV